MDATLEVIQGLGGVRDEWDLLGDFVDPPPVGWLNGWAPWPKQAQAAELADVATLTLFGGSAGPGKTELLLELAVREMRRYPNNLGVLTRRIYPSLQMTVIDRMNGKLANESFVRWEASHKRFRFSNGSLLYCRSLQHLDDVQEFQGVEIGWLGIEEITEFAESQIEFLVKRLRPPTGCPSPRARAMATANPGGRGHAWVKRWFVRPKDVDVDPDSPPPAPFTVWIPSSPSKREPDEPPMTRCYVPATHEDNPSLSKAYIANLRSTKDRRLREAMLHGDWDAIDAIEGALVTGQDLENGRVKEGHVERLPSWLRVLAVDPSDAEAGGNKFGVAQVARGSDGCAYVERVAGLQLSQRKTGEALVEWYHEVGASCLVVERNHGSRWLPAFLHTIDQRLNIVTVWASDGKLTRARGPLSLFEFDASAGVHKARMVGVQDEIEQQLLTTTFQPGDPSPDEIDALVWGLHYLMMDAPEPVRTTRVRDQRLRGRR